MGRVIALLGAECTGKSTLAERLARDCNGVAVAEYLREWCDTHGRTPRQHEQAAIAEEQARRIEEAARGSALVFADTTPLITALCSQHYFADDSLLTQALAFQRRCDLTLVCAPDLPWVPDGIQRDGPEVRKRFHERLIRCLDAAALPWTEIEGELAQRLKLARARL